MKFIMLKNMTYNTGVFRRRKEKAEKE